MREGQAKVGLLLRQEPPPEPAAEEDMALKADATVDVVVICVDVRKRLVCQHGLGPYKIF